jgi:hypothetical protein
MAMRTSSRVDYDAIAHLYDGQPYRGKTVDPELVTFMAQRASSDRPSILDIACGTGSQLWQIARLCPMPGWLASISHSACCVRHSPNRGTLPGSKQMPRCCPFCPSVLISSVANSRSITSATSQVFCVPS